MATTDPYQDARGALEKIQSRQREFSGSTEDIAQLLGIQMPGRFFMGPRSGTIERRLRNATLARDLVTRGPLDKLRLENERLKQELLGQQISDQRIESKFRKQQIKDAMDWFAARPQLRAFGTSPGEAISVAMGLEQFEAQQKEAEDQRKFRDEILGKLSGGEDQEADDAMQFGSEIADWVNEQAAGTIGIGLRPEMLQSIKNRAVGALAKGQSREAVFEFVASQTQQWLAQAQLQKQAALTSATEPEIQGPPLPEGMGPMGGARSLVLPDVIGPSFTEFIRGANARAAPPSPPAFSTATAGRRL